MSGNRKVGSGRAQIHTLAELVADPELERRKRVTAVPFMAWMERVTLLAAREKDGKSTFAGAAAAAVSSGTDFLGIPVPQRPVLWIGLEEHAAEITERLVQFGANEFWVFVMTSAASALDELEDAVWQLKDLGIDAPLVVIDTLGALVGGEVDDAGSSTQWTPVMHRLTKIAREDGASVLILHHARKSDGEYRDSSAIGANVDMLLKFGTPSPTRRTVSGRGRWSHKPFTVEFEGTYSLVSGGKSIEEWILDFVASNPRCSLRAVRDGVVGANADVDSAVKRLLASGEIENLGTSSGYELVVADGNRAEDGNP